MKTVFLKIHSLSHTIASLSLSLMHARTHTHTHTHSHTHSLTHSHTLSLSHPSCSISSLESWGRWTALKKIPALPWMQKTNKPPWGQHTCVTHRGNWDTPSGRTSLKRSTCMYTSGNWQSGRTSLRMQTQTYIWFLWLCFECEKQVLQSLIYVTWRGMNEGRWFFFKYVLYANTSRFTCLTVSLLFTCAV